MGIRFWREGGIKRAGFDDMAKAELLINYISCSNVLRLLLLFEWYGIEVFLNENYNANYLFNIEGVQCSLGGKKMLF